MNGLNPYIKTQNKPNDPVFRDFSKFIISLAMPCQGPDTQLPLWRGVSGSLHHKPANVQLIAIYQSFLSTPHVKGHSGKAFFPSDSTILGL